MRSCRGAVDLHREAAGGSSKRRTGRADGPRRRRGAPRGRVPAARPLTHGGEAAPVGAAASCRCRPRVGAGEDSAVGGLIGGCPGCRRRAGARSRGVGRDSSPRSLAAVTVDVRRAGVTFGVVGRRGQGSTTRAGARGVDDGGRGGFDRLPAARRRRRTLSTAPSRTRRRSGPGLSRRGACRRAAATGASRAHRSESVRPVAAPRAASTRTAAVRPRGGPGRVGRQTSRDGGGPTASRWPRFADGDVAVASVAGACRGRPDRGRAPPAVRRRSRAAPGRPAPLDVAGDRGAVHGSRPRAARPTSE
jgi:hypothetical protein